MTKAVDTTTNPGKVGQAEVDRAIADLTAAVNELSAKVIQGVSVEGIRVESSPATIKLRHGLGRKPKGFMVTRIKYATPQELHEVASPNPERELLLSYVGSTDIELDFKVF